MYVKYRVPWLFDGSSEVFPGGGFGLYANGNGIEPREQGGYMLFSILFRFLLATSLYALAFGGLDFLCLHHALCYTDTLHIA